MPNTDNNYILIRGAGELGSAAAVTLYKTGFNPILTEITTPYAIRRKVTFSDVVFIGESEVDGVKAKFIKDVKLPLNPQFIPLIIDEPILIRHLKIPIIIDARMIKKYDDDYRSWSKLYVGLGPGFSAGKNCHVVIETNRGHSLGRIIWDGEPEINTGIPGNIGGETNRRVIYSKTEGELSWDVNFGNHVKQHQIIGKIGSSEIRATITGTIRGLINPNINITTGLKIADIDPRENVDCTSISDKSSAIARAVLEAVMTGNNR